MFTTRKSILRTIIPTFALVTLFMTTSAVSADSSGYIQGENVNIRSKPSLSSDCVASISHQEVIVQSNSGNWSKISFGKKEGWVRSDFITLKKQSSTTNKSQSNTNQKATSKSGNATLKGDNINIRSKPSTSAKIVANLSNKPVNILGTSGDWYKISYNGTVGWVKKDFLSSTDINNTKNKISKATVSGSLAIIKGTNINIRSKPTTTSKVVTKLSGKAVNIQGTSGDWYKISYNGTVGWVKKDLVSITGASSLPATSNTKQQASDNKASTSVVIDGSNVNIRSKPTTTAKVVTKLSKQKVTILSQSGDWYKISSGKTTGWVLKDLVSVPKGKTIASETYLARAESNTATPEAASVRSKMVVYSRNFLGVHYRYGGTSPAGFDCSGFTGYIYRRFGINLDRVSTDQAKQGKYVPKNKLQSGDLVFFDTNGGKNKVVNHAGMYIGNGKFIHASSARTGSVVRISSLNESFYAKTYVTGRTFVK